LVRDFSYVLSICRPHQWAIVSYRRWGQYAAQTEQRDGTNDYLSSKSVPGGSGPGCRRVRGNARCHSDNSGSHNPADWISRRQCLRQRRERDSVDARR
jgi:hypothetical protein